MRQEEAEAVSEGVVEPGEEGSGGGSGEAPTAVVESPHARYGPLQTEWRQNQFLEALRRQGTVASACRAVQGAVSNVRRWRTTNEAFDLACLDALEDFKEAAEEEMWRRATKGVRQYRFDKDGNVLIDPLTNEPYYEMVYSDRLLEFALKGADPTKYADKRVHSGGVALGLIPLGAIREALKGSESG